MANNNGKKSYTFHHHRHSWHSGTSSGNVFASISKDGAPGTVSAGDPAGSGTTGGSGYYNSVFPILSDGTKGKHVSSHSRSGSIGRMFTSLTAPLSLHKADHASSSPPGSPPHSLKHCLLGSGGGGGGGGMHAMKNAKIRNKRSSMLMLMSLFLVASVLLLVSPPLTLRSRRRTYDGSGLRAPGRAASGDFTSLQITKYHVSNPKIKWPQAGRIAGAAVSPASASVFDSPEMKMLQIHDMYYGRWEGSFELKEEDDTYSAARNYGTRTGVTFGEQMSRNENWLPPWPKQKHKIAVFTGAYSHIVDGVSLTLNKLVAFLESHGHEVLVIAPVLPGGESAVKDPAGTILPTFSLSVPFRPEYRGSMPLTSSMVRTLDEFEPTIVHIATPDILGMDAMRWIRGYNARRAAADGGDDAEKSAVVPIVCSYHTRFNSYLKYYGLKFVEPVLWAYLKSFYSGCMHVYPPTPEVGNELVEHGLRSDQVRLWPRGVNITHFSPARRSEDFRASIFGRSPAHADGVVGDAENAPLRATATADTAGGPGGVSDDGIIMLFVSRLVLEKGLNVFAETVELILAHDIQVQIVVVGEGPARAELEKRFRGHIKASVGGSISQADDGVGQKTITFLGAKSGLALAEIYASCDFFFFPSLTEGWGNVALEAMASGLPVIGAHATGTTFLVKDNVTGFLSRPNNAYDMFQHVKTMVDDAELRRSMGMKARKWARSFTWDRAFSLLMRHYQEAVDLVNGQEAISE